jgi:anti-sigma regulatory factor (Ser/Thr protein kinase)
MTLEPSPTAARVARHAVGEWLTEWDLVELVDTVMVIVSELVTNAVRHAHTSLEVSLAADRWGIEMAVRDGDHRRPHQPEYQGGDAPSFAENGRGITIIEGLAHRWGVVDLVGGKKVWATLNAPPGWGHHHVCPL